MEAAVKIDFLVPGFSKCGTTTLCALLAQHPQLFIPEFKEPWYFSATDMAARTRDYLFHFEPAEPGQLLGEGSVSYSSYEHEDRSIDNIRAVNPDCRFIFIARDPLKRIESSYREMHHSGVKFGLDAPFGLSENLDRFPQMIEDSKFMERMSKYEAAFGRESILVLFLEDLQQQPRQALSRCFAHLGVDEQFQVEVGLKLNAGASKLYDTPVLRKIRNTRSLGGLQLARLSPEQQDRLLRPLGLRRPFRRPIKWDEASLARVRDEIGADAQAFLRRCGKPKSFWEWL